MGRILARALALLLVLPGIAAGAAGPTLAQWAALYGAPARAASAGAGAPAEAQLVYWMQVRAAPLGVGPALPGTLVANFAAGAPAETAGLEDFTFLAVASPAEASALEALLRERGWVVGERTVERSGGTFRELSLSTPLHDGTLALREGAPSPGMADGRPSPTLWIHATIRG